MQPAIKTTDLTKFYGDVRALNDLNLEVNPGEIFGFLGPNGAGKTTTIRLLLDLIRPTSGSATILGLDCNRESHLVRARTGYLAGDLRLFETRTGRSTIRLIGGLRDGPTDWEYVESIAARLALNLDVHVGTLSKGNRQKIGILLALFDRPDVLLLDEPTSGLDPLSQRVVWEMLREETQRGTTVFFSSHVMSEVEQLCHRVAILRRGELVAVEPITALKERVTRRLEVTFSSSVPASIFALSDTRILEHTDNRFRLEVSGQVDAIIKAISEYPVMDLRTEQASLDEILLNYYEETPS